MKRKKIETDQERSARLMSELNLFMFASTLTTVCCGFYEGEQRSWLYLTMILLLVLIVEFLVAFLAASAQRAENGWTVIWFSQMGIKLLIVLTLLVSTGELPETTIWVAVGGTWLSIYLYYYRTWNS